MLSVRGRHGRCRRCTRVCHISIHALREEGDSSTPSSQVPTSEFLSTPSARKATVIVSDIRDLEYISIHALREEGDPARPGAAAAMPYFYPRPPRGGRPRASIQRAGMAEFLSTPSARRATFADVQAAGRDLFLSTPSARRATLFGLILV